jgi:Protein of unknown function (DUF3800)
MYLMFLDNSYIQENNINVNCLGGFIIGASEYNDLIKKLAEIKISYGLKPSDPVKWSPSEDSPRHSPQRSIPRQNEFKKAVLSLLNNSPIKIACVLINSNQDVINEQRRAGLITRSDANRIRVSYEIRALEYLAQRFQMELQQISDSRGQIILEANSNMSSRIAEEYHKTWHDGSGEFNMQFDRLMDSITYSHDFACAGLQLADFVISSTCHALKSSYYEYVKLYRDRFRRVNNQVKGIGIVVYPSNLSFADNLIRIIER